MREEKEMIQSNAGTEAAAEKEKKKSTPVKRTRKSTADKKKKPGTASSPMRILMVGSEALPFVSSGGLGDVLGSLPAALKSRMKKGADIRVVLPMYGQIKAEWRDQMQFLCAMQVQLAWRNQYCGIFSLEREGVTWYFLDNQYYFYRDAIYGQYDDGERYAFFSLAVLEMMRQLDWYPHVLHAHDWQSALSVIYLKRRYFTDPKFSSIRTVYTIHNVEYQGRYPRCILEDVFALSSPDCEIVEYDGDINLAKGAIVCCDCLTTVSKRYAEELRDPYFAHGLEHIIQLYADKTVGIVNGIDVAYYHPGDDKDLPFSFDEDHLGGKAANKADLQRALGLTLSPDTPIVAMITRLAEHKGLDLVCRVLDEIMEKELQFVLLGTGEPRYAQFFADFAQRHPGRAAVVLDFDKALSKRIYAGADIFLMPSKREPCGLAQMIACRYGTLPIVHAVGGLADTVTPIDAQTCAGNGFCFYRYNAHDMKDAIERAAVLYEDRSRWEKLMHNAMTTDFSWQASAAQYEELYRGLI